LYTANESDSTRRWTMEDQETRAALEEHWSGSPADDLETALDKADLIYHDDVVVEYPQSGERILGRRNLRALREAYPANVDFAIRRIRGGGDLWVTEYVITYDGRPVHTVSIMEFQAGKVARETLYFADPFEAPEWRAHLVERMEP
jgi:SnoaL-like domain